MDTAPLLTWEEPPPHRTMKLERNLNFATLVTDEDEYGFSRKKTTRDPMSHRIIEKRRRDRMNKCLADLSRLVPTNYLKKGRGRIEKTEIIEMAIKHLKHLQGHACSDPGTCELAEEDQFRYGYTECMNEVLRFLAPEEGLQNKLAGHLQKHYEKMTGELCYTPTLSVMVSDESKSSMHMDTDNNHSNHPCFPKSVSCEPSDLKPTSQLREMLENPAVPSSESNLKTEDGCYKFKNTIKHRFNADVRHHTSSPTDSHLSSSDRISLPDEDSHVNMCNGFSSSTAAVSDQHWDSSSCGSPPPNAGARSNGSSSGYSTNGENHHPTKMKESISPYSRTPDRLSNSSPTPSSPGVPVFALHPKGTFYIPLTLESSLLTPHMSGVDELTPVLHPISICVNLSGHSFKVIDTLHCRPSSYLMDQNDRLIYPDRPTNYYTSPSARNGLCLT